MRPDHNRISDNVHRICKTIRSKYCYSSALMRGAFSVVALISISSAAQAQSTGPVFDCDGLAYTVIGKPSVLNKLDPATLIETPIGALPIDSNAIGFNAFDGYIYGLSGKNIIRIDANGNTENLGEPTGPGNFKPRTAMGTLDTLGNYYLISTSQIFIVSIGNNPAAGTLTYTAVTRSGDISTPNDLAFSTVDDALYGTTKIGLIRIDPSSGIGSVVATTGIALKGAGGAWSTSSGTAYFYANGPGELYSVDLTQSPPVVAFAGNVPANKSFDATACTPPLLTKKASLLETPAGSSYSYTYNISNAFGTNALLSFSDVLPAGITYDNVTLSPSNPGGGTVTTFDSTNLEIVGMSVPSLGELTFEVTVDVGSSVAGGTHIDNQANITFGGNIFLSDDPSTGPFQDPARVTITAPDIVAQDDDFTASPIAPGGSTPSVFAGDSIGGNPATSSNVSVSLTDVDGLTGATINPDGTIDIPAGASAGTYVLTYEICESPSGTPCTSATVTITVLAPSADLSITKTNTPGVNTDIDQASDTVTSGQSTTYTLVVTNNGPDGVTGAVVTDTPSSGLTCSAADAVTLTGDGLPAGTFTIADLTGAGITLGALLDGQSTTLTYSCDVN